MTTYDFTIKDEEPVLIRLGRGEEIYEIDVSFINSAKGFQMQNVLSHRKDDEPITPGIMSQIIAIASRGQVPETVNADWIQQNTDYSTLEKSFTITLSRAYGRAEKNV